MKDSPDVTEKTSRRRFNKTLASALVTMPVISSLSSCAQKPPTPVPPPGTPSPTPSGTPDERFMLASNPPIIIDGGSLSISLGTELKRMKDTSESPPWKHIQKDKVYGAINRVRLMNDYGYPVHGQQLDFPVGQSDLELKIWLQTADDDKDHPGEVIYLPQPIPSTFLPQFLLRNKGEGRTFEIRYVDEIDSSDKVYKNKLPQRKYKENKLKPGTGTFLGKDFRIGKVGIKVGTTDFETDESAADYGFRIVVFMDAPEP